MERNLKEPSLEALRRLSECLECSIVWLILDSPHTLEDADGNDGTEYLGSKALFLEPGDNLYIPSGAPHNLKSSDDTAAVVLVHMSAVIG